MTTRRRKHRLREYGLLVMILLIATETTILGSLQVSSETPVLLWLSNPGVLMTMLLGGVITLLFRAYGDPNQSLWAGLITSAVTLAAAITVLADTAFPMRRPNLERISEQRPMTLHEAPVGAVLQRPDATENNMNYDLFAMIIAFIALTLIMNRHTVTLTRQIDELRKETAQRFESSHNEMIQFRTEMNRRFDEANTERNRQFDTISHDMADLRERMARVEENLRTRETRPQNAA